MGQLAEREVERRRLQLSPHPVTILIIDRLVGLLEVIMVDVWVAGVGLTSFGKHEGRSSAELFTEAAHYAFRDAGRVSADVDEVIFGNVLGSEIESQVNMAPKVAGLLGLTGKPVTRVENACATSGVALRLGYMLIKSGMARTVLVGGGERVRTVPGDELQRLFAHAMDQQYEATAGVTFPAVFALSTRAYMDKYGATEKDFAHVSVKNHENGAKNPIAQLRKPVTLQEVLDSPMVADPVKLLDCCPFTDGGSAVVLTAEKPSDGRRAVRIAGSGQGTDGFLFAEHADHTWLRAVEMAAKMAYADAQLDASALDFAEVHDCVTINEILCLEALGIFERGKAAFATVDGDTLLTGRFPVNPSGGLKSKGHPVAATGTAQIAELVMQFRGECGERQITSKPLNAAVAACVGGTGAVSAVHVLTAA